MRESRFEKHVIEGEGDDYYQYANKSTKKRKQQILVRYDQEQRELLPVYLLLASGKVVNSVKQLRS